MKKDNFFLKMEALGLALTFDDVRLKTGYSEIDPRSVPTESFFSRNIRLKVPIVSSAMLDVTEAPMAIAMAKFGGLGVIHKAMTPEMQASHVRRVKLYLNGLIEKPISVKDDQTIEEILRMRDEKEYQFHSFPVLNAENKLVGLLTKNDFDRAPTNGAQAKEMMTPMAELFSAPAGTSLQQAFDLLRQARKNTLPLVNGQGELAGMYVFSDAKRILSGTPTLYNVDKEGHLVVVAAIGTGEHELHRAKLLKKAGADGFLIDTAHGHSKNVRIMMESLERLYPEMDVIAGNVSQGESAKALAEWGADGVKVGQGPGSICTTRIIAGVGCPQVTAVYNCAKALRDSGVPVCADGGIRNSGDIVIAIGAGADSVMLGGVLAGTKETPGDIQERRSGSVKVYRGMGSAELMKKNQASRERYLQDGIPVTKLVAEGITSVVPFKGPVADVLAKQVGGLQLGMGYVGAGSIKELQEKADFDRLTNAGIVESHPHDVTEVETKHQ